MSHDCRHPHGSSWKEKEIQNVSLKIFWSHFSFTIPQPVSDSSVCVTIAATTRQGTCANRMLLAGDYAID